MKRPMLEFQGFESYGEDLIHTQDKSNLYRIFRITIRLKTKGYRWAMSLRLPKLPKLYFGYYTYKRDGNV